MSLCVYVHVSGAAAVESPHDDNHSFPRSLSSSYERAMFSSARHIDTVRTPATCSPSSQKLALCAGITCDFDRSLSRSSRKLFLCTIRRGTRVVPHNTAIRLSCQSWRFFSVMYNDPCNADARLCESIQRSAECQTRETAQRLASCVQHCCMRHWELGKAHWRSDDPRTSTGAV